MSFNTEFSNNFSPIVSQLYYTKNAGHVFTKCLYSRFVLIGPQPLSVELTEVYNIDVGLVDRLDVALLGVNPHGGGSVDARNGHSVTGLNHIHQVVVSEEYDVVWGLASRHVI